MCSSNGCDSCTKSGCSGKEKERLFAQAVTFGFLLAVSRATNRPSDPLTGFRRIRPRRPGRSRSIPPDDLIQL